MLGRDRRWKDLNFVDVGAAAFSLRRGLRPKRFQLFFNILRKNSGGVQIGLSLA